MFSSNNKIAANQKEFELERDKFVLLIIPMLMFWFVLFTIPLLGVILLFKLVMSGVYTSDGILDMIGMIVSIPITFFVTHPLINQYNKIRVAENGLYIRVFWFFYKWIFIPWEDIEEVKLSPRMDRWQKPIWVIIVKRLTFIHVILSEQYLTGSLPGIIITSDIKNREKLLDIVQSHID